MTINFDDFDEEVLDQASAWIARLRSDKVSDEDKQDFALWLAESKQNQAAFDEMLLLWQGMKMDRDDDNSELPSHLSGMLATLPLPDEPPASNDDHHDDIAPAKSSATTSRQRSHWNIGENWSIGLAASIAVIGTLLLSNLWPGSQTEKDFYSSYTTSVGEQKQIELPDGSLLHLNTNSQVELEYANDIRHLNLRQGEAYFQVAPNPDQPFVVDAGAGKITALGTAFNIYRQDRNTVVTVTEGTVSVTDSLSSQSTHKSEKQITEGQVIIVDASDGLGNIDNANTETNTAWRQHTLVFDDVELIQALKEINRYLVEPVDFSDPSLNTLKVSGTFSLKEPETTLTAIINSFSLHVEYDAETETTKLLAPTSIR